MKSRAGALAGYQVAVDHHRFIDPNGAVRLDLGADTGKRSKGAASAESTRDQGNGAGADQGK